MVCKINWKYILSSHRNKIYIRSSRPPKEIDWKIYSSREEISRKTTLSQFLHTIFQVIQLPLHRTGKILGQLLIVEFLNGVHFLQPKIFR